MTPLKIDYVELQTLSLGASRSFFADAFGWRHVDYGAHYAGFQGAGIDGGLAEAQSGIPKAPLIVLKAVDLAAAELEVIAAGGEIVKPAYAFPGGRRFHFREPGGNEMAVWSEN